MFNFWKSSPVTTVPRCILLGPDTSGKTTLLYMWKMAQVVQTYPTIGFSFQTVDLLGQKMDVIDFGGCDKLAPLAGHYIDSATGLLFLHPLDWGSEGLELSMQLLRLHVCQLIEAEGKYIWIMLTKQDIVPAEELSRKRQEVYESFRKVIETAELEYKGRVQWKVFDQPGLNVLDFMLVKPIYQEIATTLHTQKVAPKPLLPRRILSEDELREKISKDSFEDEPADVFWQGFLIADLPRWNHRSHLRAGFMVLLRSAAILDDFWTAVNQFIEHIERLRTIRPDRFRNTTHRTMTTFWLHLLQLAIIKFRNAHAEQRLPRDEEFVEVMLMYPKLVESSYWEEHYSREIMFSVEARLNWCLPDRQPLPTSFRSNNLGKPTNVKSARVMKGTVPAGANIRPTSHEHDQTRLISFALRVVQDYLISGERRGKVIANALSKLQKFTMQQRALQTPHAPHVYSETQSYFWIQIVHATLLPFHQRTSTASETVPRSMATLAATPASAKHLTHNQFMHIFDVEPTFWKQYYSPSLWASVKARMSFVNPDLQSLPNVFPKPAAEVVANRFLELQSVLLDAVDTRNSDGIDSTNDTWLELGHSPEETPLLVDAVVAEVEEAMNPNVIPRVGELIIAYHGSEPATLHKPLSKHSTLLFKLYRSHQRHTDPGSGTVKVSDFVADVLSGYHNLSMNPDHASASPPKETSLAHETDAQRSEDFTNNRNPNPQNELQPRLDSTLGVTQAFFYARMTLALSSNLSRDSSDTATATATGRIDDETTSLQSFRAFLVARAALAWEELPFRYYRPETWHSLDARVMMVAPDLRPLPDSYSESRKLKDMMENNPIDCCCQRVVD